MTLTGPNGQSVPAQVKDTGSQTFQVEFSPRVAGEHRISVAYRKVAIAGSPFSCKVYDVKAIKVKDVAEGIVAKPITFLGKYKWTILRHCIKFSVASLECLYSLNKCGSI